MKVLTAPFAKKNVGKINTPAAAEVEEKIVRPVADKKEGEKPAPKKAAKKVEDNPWMTMKNAEEGVAPKEEVKAVQQPQKEKKAAPKKEAPKKEAPAYMAPAAAPAKKDDPNDFMAQMQKAAVLNEE